jgi:SAM-dependent methyltransferase
MPSNEPGGRAPLELRESYDRVADAYAAKYFAELEHKSLDRMLLDHLASELRGRGPVADVGCGPGQIARYLHGHGVETLGLDISPGMVAVARRLSPEIPFLEGSMLSLPAVDGAWAGIAAFYSIIHVPEADTPRAFAEFFRVLAPGGLLLVSFHVGKDIVHVEELLDTPVSLDFRFLETDAVARGLEDAGLVVTARLERRPYVEFEYPSTRAYLLAAKPV